MEISRRFSGTGTAKGAITMKQDAVGFFADAGQAHVFTGGMPYKTADVTISGTATVAIQGCVGDPSVTGNWYTVSSVSANGFLRWTGQDDFVRADTTSFTSGTQTVRLSATSL